MLEFAIPPFAPPAELPPALEPPAELAAPPGLVPPAALEVLPALLPAWPPFEAKLAAVFELQAPSAKAAPNKAAKQAEA